MDDFDDLSIEDFSTFDFVEELFEEEEKTIKSLLILILIPKLITD
jgi:hypothetical protein